MKRLLATLALFWLSLVPALAQFVGRYNVEGQNPNGSMYAGTSEVSVTGDTFRVIWSVDGVRFTGTAIGNDQAAAITYRSGNDTGVALAAANGAGYIIVWTFAGGRTVGTERWTRR